MRLWDAFRKGEKRSLDLGDYYNLSNQSGALVHAQGLMPGSETIEVDYETFAARLYKESPLIWAVCMRRGLVFSEARFMYQLMNQGRPEDLVHHEALSILETPWPNSTTGELLYRALLDVDLCGNAFVVNEGDRLRRLRPDWVEIVLTAPVDQAKRADVAGYIYRPGGTTNRDLWEAFPIDGSNGAVAHWSPYPDPQAQFRGMTWMTPVLREVMLDQVATKHKRKYFEQGTQPSLAISFKETVTPEQFQQFMSYMDENKSGADNAYKNLYLGGGADITPISADMKSISFRDLQGQTETRIAAASGVPPSLVGFSEGLQGSTLNEGNHKAAINSFADGVMMPLWRSMCAAFAVLVPQADNARLWFDTRDIPFLNDNLMQAAEARNKDAETVNKLIMAGFTPESSVLFVAKDDIMLLEHTGLVSVQLLPPGLTQGQAEGTAGPDAEAKPEDDPNGKAPNGTAENPSDPNKTPKTPTQSKYGDGTKTPAKDKRPGRSALRFTEEEK